MTRDGLPKYVYRIHGKLRYQRRGFPSHTFDCQDQHDPAFYAEYLRVVRGVQAPPAGRTWRDLLRSYRHSDRWTDLAASSRRKYEQHFHWLERNIGDRDPRAMKRTDLMSMRASDSMTAAQFNYRLKLVKLLLDHACDLGLRSDNPARGVRSRRYEKTTREPWPADKIAAFRAAADHRTLLLFELLLGSGQRIGDVLAMRWGDYRKGTLHVVQSKTGAKVEVPATRRLRALLDAEPRRCLFILTDRDGTGPWTYRLAARAMLVVRRKIGAEAWDQHSLRYSAAAELASLGCSDEMIASVTGHTSARMVALYAGPARQRARAKEAQARRDGTGTERE